MSSTREGMIDAGAKMAEDDGRSEFDGHDAGCRGGAADCTCLAKHALSCPRIVDPAKECECGATPRPGAPPEPSAADLPDGEYAIAEILGHSTMIGRYAEVERFGTKMLQIEPIWQNKLLPAAFVGGASLYRFVPCSKDIAFARQPTQPYQLPETIRATLPVPGLPALSPPAEDDDPDFREVDEEERPQDEF